MFKIKWRWNIRCMKIFLLFDDSKVKYVQLVYKVGAAYGITLGQRETDSNNRLMLNSEWTRAGVPNLFSARYHRINKLNFHIPLNEQKTFLCTTIVKPWTKKHIFWSKNMFPTFCVPPETSLRTTSGTRTTGWEPLN